jgi:hypothetical protein
MAVLLALALPFSLVLAGLAAHLQGHQVYQNVIGAA